jgi:hypothetical protein
MAQLRDDVLRDEFSASRRKKLWEKVQAKVELNSNVRSSVKTDLNGEVGRVWEWIGSVGALENSPYVDKVDRRKSGGGYRSSMGGLAGERLLEPAGAEIKNENISSGRWEEKQAYY